MIETLTDTSDADRGGADDVMETFLGVGEIKTVEGASEHVPYEAEKYSTAGFVCSLDGHILYVEDHTKSLPIYRNLITGRADPGEDYPPATMSREAVEETGIDVSPDGWEEVGRWSRGGRANPHVYFLFKLVNPPRNLEEMTAMVPAGVLGVLREVLPGEKILAGIMPMSFLRDKEGADLFLPPSYKILEKTGLLYKYW